MAQPATRTKDKNFETKIQKISANKLSETAVDFLAVEEPLEIRLGFSENGKQIHKAVSITMRTPGNDFELAAGFLFTEGILTSKNQIKSIKHCGKFPNNQNTVRIDLSENTKLKFGKIDAQFLHDFELRRVRKNFARSVKYCRSKKDRAKRFSENSAEIIHELPKKLLQNQTVFGETGGLHAAALFDVSGNLIDLREDVGRHNAVDKLIGKQFLDNNLPLADKDFIFERTRFF